MRICSVGGCGRQFHARDLCDRHYRRLRDDGEVGGDIMVRPKATDTHCVHGHEWTPENTRVGKDGSRRCGICNKVRSAVYRTTPRHKATWRAYYAEYKTRMGTEPKDSKEHVVYRHYADGDVLLYVGYSSCVDERQKDHRASAPWWSEGVRMEIVRYDTRDEALWGELRAIRTEHPLWNIQGRASR